MIDTVRFTFRGAIPAGGRRGCKLTERSTSSCWSDDEGTPFFNFTMTDEDTGARFMGCVNPRSVEERYCVEMVELSVPRLAFGHNYREVPREGFKAAIESVVSYCREMAPVDQQQADLGLVASLELKRVDLVKQFRASSADLIAAHRATKHPAMRSGGCEWFGESIAWKGKERMLRMYDKLQEAGKLREPSDVTRLELETRGQAMDRDLGPRVYHLKALTFDGCYSSYRAHILKLQPSSLPAAAGWVEFLAMLQRAGVRIDGVPIFDVWARTKGKSTIRRVRSQIAAVRPAYWAWDWSLALPADPALVRPVEPTPEELQRYGVACAA